MNPLVFLEAATLSSILTDIGSIVTAAITWCGQFITEITGQPLLLLFVLMSSALFGIHIMKSLMGR